MGINTLKIGAEREAFELTAIIFRTVTTPQGRGSTVVPSPEALGWRSPSAGKSIDAKA
jgi:hypothetical protein